MHVGDERSSWHNWYEKPSTISCATKIMYCKHSLKNNKSTRKKFEYNANQNSLHKQSWWQGVGSREAINFFQLRNSLLWNSFIQVPNYYVFRTASYSLGRHPTSVDKFVTFDTLARRSSEALIPKTKPLALHYFVKLRVANIYI